MDLGLLMITKVQSSVASYLEKCYCYIEDYIYVTMDGSHIYLCASNDVYVIICLRTKAI